MISCSRILLPASAVVHRFLQHNHTHVVSPRATLSCSMPANRESSNHSACMLLFAALRATPPFRHTYNTCGLPLCRTLSTIPAPLTQVISTAMPTASEWCKTFANVPKTASMLAGSPKTKHWAAATCPLGTSPKYRTASLETSTSTGAAQAPYSIAQTTRNPIQQCAPVSNVVHFVAEEDNVCF